MPTLLVLTGTELDMDDWQSKSRGTYARRRWLRSALRRDQGARCASHHMICWSGPQVRIRGTHMPKRLPVELKKQPLMEALCELRVSGGVPLNLSVPGILLSQRPSDVSSVHALPSIPVTDQVLQLQPNLAFVPQVELKFKELLVRTSARSIAISNPKPYLGWGKLKPIVVDILTMVLASRQVSGVERYSLKYLDLLDTNIFPDPTKALAWSVGIGALELDTPATMLRAQVKESESLVSIVTLTGGVDVRIGNLPPAHGTLVDIDTIQSDLPTDIDRVINELSKSLDHVHDVNKKTFFECLTEEAVRELDPVY